MLLLAVYNSPTVEVRNNQRRSFHNARSGTVSHLLALDLMQPFPVYVGVFYIILKARPNLKDKSAVFISFSRQFRGSPQHVHSGNGTRIFVTVVDPVDICKDAQFT